MWRGVAHRNCLQLTSTECIGVSRPDHTLDLRPAMIPRRTLPGTAPRGPFVPHGREDIAQASDEGSELERPAWKAPRTTPPTSMVASIGRSQRNRTSVQSRTPVAGAGPRERGTPAPGGFFPRRAPSFGGPPGRASQVRCPRVWPRAWRRPARPAAGGPAPPRRSPSLRDGGQDRDTGSSRSRPNRAKFGAASSRQCSAPGGLGGRGCVRRRLDAGRGDDHSDRTDRERGGLRGRGDPVPRASSRGIPGGAGRGSGGERDRSSVPRPGPSRPRPIR